MQEKRCSTPSLHSSGSSNREVVPDLPALDVCSWTVLRSGPVEPTTITCLRESTMVQQIWPDAIQPSFKKGLSRWRATEEGTWARNLSLLLIERKKARFVTASLEISA